MKYLCLLAAFSMLAAGCAPPRAKPAAAPATAKVATVVEADPRLSSKEIAPVKTIAAEFLANLSKGDVKTSQLSDDFKKRIARPHTEEEKKAGYSEFLLQGWLEKLSGVTYKKESESSLQSNDYAMIGTVAGGPAPEFFVLRIRMLPGKGPEVSWFHRSRIRSGDRVAAQPVSPDMEAARDFVEVACGGDPLLTAALLSPNYKAKLAPPFDSEKDLGYNPGMLNLKMKAWQATACKLEPPTEFGKFTGELTQGEKKVPFSLRLENYGGDWLVESFEIK